MIGLSNWMLWAAYFFTFLTLYSGVIFLMCLIFFAKASVYLLQLNLRGKTDTWCGPLVFGLPGNEYVPA